jgi:DNA-directed RNA polymerase specialized sigma24 family protein
VTRETFVRALRELPSLGRGVEFEPWLFSTAYREAVARAERAVPEPSPAHEEAFGSFEAPDPARLDDPSVAGGDHELAALVWEASTALNPRDYALLDLHARQGLGTGAIAQLLGVGKSTAKTMIDRMEAAADDVLSSYVVARRATASCEGLRAALEPHDVPPYTEQARAAVDAHLRECDTCGALRRGLPSTVAIFASFAAVQAPLSLKGDIWGEVAASWGSRANRGGGVAGPVGVAALEADRDRVRGVPPEAAMASAAAAGRDFDGAGAPPPWGTPATGGGWDRRQLLWFGGAVLGLMIFAFAGGAIIAGVLGGGDDDDNAAGPDGSATPARTRTVVGTLTPGVAVQTATPDLTASAFVPPTDTPAPATPTPLPVSTDTPAPPVVTPTTPPTAATTAATPIPGVVTVTPGIPTTTPSPLVPEGTVVGIE